MGELGRGKIQIGVVVDAPLAELIRLRAEASDKSRSRFGLLIFKYWVAMGCPPVSKADRLVQNAMKDNESFFPSPRTSRAGEARDAPPKVGA